MRLGHLAITVPTTTSTITRGQGRSTKSHNFSLIMNLIQYSGRMVLPGMVSFFRASTTGHNGETRCDERFVGYGGNKAACLFEMYLSGMSFYVLSDHFLIHQNHLYEENARKNEVSSHFCAQLG